MKTALVIRHVAFEDLGTLEPVLQERGFAIQYLEMGLDDLRHHDPVAYDLAVILGGPIGAYEQQEYPFLVDELVWVRRRLDAKKPTLGLCLGAQLMAAALGAKVYPGAMGKEIGWSELSQSEAASHHPFMSLLDTAVLHWHGDTFDLPEGAVLLASSTQYAHQVYAIGKHALAFQCHPEVTQQGLERWYIGHACEIAKTEGVSVPDLRAQAARHAPMLEAAAPGLWNLWLDGLF